MKILMVCLGNICRSPIAEGILRKLIEENKLDWQVDSAGTGSWHIGEAPDKRAIRTAAKFGVDISELKARQFTADDFQNFDRIFVMDESNLSDVSALAQGQQDIEKVGMLLNLSQPGSNLAVADPWFDESLFEPVFKQLEIACMALVAQKSIAK